MWIKEESANLLLAGTGASVADLREIAAGLESNAIAKLPTGLEAAIESGDDPPRESSYPQRDRPSARS